MIQKQTLICSPKLLSSWDDYELMVEMDGEEALEIVLYKPPDLIAFGQIIHIIDSEVR